MANLVVYYDGKCHLCSREIAHYYGQPGSDEIRFVDITTPAFNAKAEGIDPKRVHREMHVRRRDGSLAIGVEAFMAIWEVLPRYFWVAKLAHRPPINLCLRVGYQVFAKIRPYLPRRKESCSLPLRSEKA